MTRKQALRLAAQRKVRKQHREKYRRFVDLPLTISPGQWVAVSV